MSSPISEHMDAHNDSFVPEAVTVKCKEKAWLRCGIAEAIWIANEGNPSPNRDRGRHILPPVYNQLLSSRDTHITDTHGARDDSETADN